MRLDPRLHTILHLAGGGPTWQATHMSALKGFGEKVGQEVVPANTICPSMAPLSPRCLLGRTLPLLCE